MKISRTLSLLLGALSCAAGLFAQALPALPKRAEGYREVSTLEMKDTMKGRKNLIVWTCWAEHSVIDNKPAKRITAWNEGVLKDAPGASPGLSLFDIGAQHRQAKIKLRIKSRSGNVTLTQVTDANGKPTTVAPTKDTNGFYTIEPARPGGGSVVNQYEIHSTEKNIVLEAYFAAHPPGTPFLAINPVQNFQIEDGGPPSVPPVNEN